MAIGLSHGSTSNTTPYNKHQGQKARPEPRIFLQKGKTVTVNAASCHLTSNSSPANSNTVTDTLTGFARSLNIRTCRFALGAVCIGWQFTMAAAPTPNKTSEFVPNTHTDNSSNPWAVPLLVLASMGITASICIHRMIGARNQARHQMVEVEMPNNDAKSIISNDDYPPLYHDAIAIGEFSETDPRHKPPQYDATWREEAIEPAEGSFHPS